MSRVWLWLTSGRLPIVVTTPRRQWRHARNAFELGRDYERGELGGAIADVSRRVDALDTVMAALEDAK